MSRLSVDELETIETAYQGFRAFLARSGISIRLGNDFDTYLNIRAAHGDRHLNQAFDPRHTKFSSGDFWLLAKNIAREPIATYCLRRFVADDFFDLVRSLKLWHSKRPRRLDPRYIVDCKIPPFGGEVVHGGGLWIRNDYRGASRLAFVMPHLARAIAMRLRPFDHDSGMIRNDPGDRAEVADRKVVFMGKNVYGFARVHRFVDGWFPPEQRHAVMYLCHASRAEAIASLIGPHRFAVTSRQIELRKRSFIDQDNKPVDAAPILCELQQQTSIGIRQSVLHDIN